MQRPVSVGAHLRGLLAAFLIVSASGLRASAAQGVSSPAPDAPAAQTLDFAIAPAPAWVLGRPTAAAAFGCLVLSGLFLLLYAYRRRIYILQWTLSWLLLTASLGAISVETGNASVARALLGLSAFFAIAAILLFVMAADTFQRRAWHGHRYLIGLLPLFIWFTLAPIVLGSRSVLMPGYLIAAVALGVGAVAYLIVLRATRMLGAGVIGTTLLLLAVSHASAAYTMARDGQNQLAFGLMLTHAVLYVVAALGMQILAFEDTTFDLRRANRELVETHAELERAVMTDPLTACHNRRFFDQVIGRELQRHERYAIPLSLLFVDVDHFKAVNDAFGHEIGDQLLKYVARFLHRHVREADYVFRWGGDEFLVLISCTLDAAHRKGTELKAAFHAAVEPAGLPEGVGLSVGCSEVVARTDDIMERVREADQRMYQDKVAAR